MNKEIFKKLEERLKGEISFEDVVLKKYSRDTSIFEITPTAVIFPSDFHDLSEIVRFVTDKKHENPTLSITARSGGTDMTGGAIGEGLILDFTKHLNKFEINTEEKTATVQPGVFYRDFEKESLKNDLIMPVYPASKDIAAFGGMIANNCGGEKSLRYGQMKNFVKSLRVVLSNGTEHTFKKISLNDLEKIKKENTYVSEIYRRIHELIEENYELIQMSKPKTTKNSSGYYIWNILNKEEKTFDLTQLITGSQGTLGLWTSAEIDLIEVKKHKKLITVFFDGWDSLPQVVNKMLVHSPESMEVFDDTTLKLGLRFMPEIAKKVGQSFFSFALKFLPEFVIGIKMMGLPKLVMLLELEEESEDILNNKVIEITKELKEAKSIFRVIDDEKEAQKYFVVRRESFNLLRQKVKDKQTAPFIDDICVNTDKFPEFLPKLLDILKKNEIKINIVGHAGSGNLHIIPLMDLKKESERNKIPLVSDEVYKLVNQYDGTITAEHNDGIIRTPYVERMFGTQMYNLFKEVKEIFDPNNVFNPGKKVGGTVEYANKHMKKG